MRARRITVRSRSATVTIRIAACITACTTALVAAPGHASAQPGPDEVVVVAADGGGPLVGGGGDTEFTLQLPEGAACPGDSESADYRVQSFLVPVDADPGSLVYQGLRPQVDGGWALYEVNTDTYVNRATAQAAEPGGEGAIINVPSFSFAVFNPGMLPIGRAHIGIACSLFTETERHWSTEVEIVADPDDAAGIAWTVVDPPAGAGRGAGAPIAQVGALAAVGGALAVAFVLWGRRRRVDAPSGQTAPNA